MWTYNEVFEASKEYFNGNELSAKVFVDKYALRNNNEYYELTPDDMHRRIAKELARIEKGKFKKPLSEDEIFDYLKFYERLIPQGSILAGCGNPFQVMSLANCFVVGTEEGEGGYDSYQGIHLLDSYISAISCRRGGIGFDISFLRPAGMSVKNAANTTTGAVSFMDRFSNTGREVAQGGRRAALMCTISVHHPEVVEFAQIKRDLKKVTGANISVKVTNEFLEAVENNTDYEQRFPVDSKTPQFSRMVNAKEVWDKIVECAHSMAEPGILFWDNILNESPAACYDKYREISTNPSLTGDTLVLTNYGVKPIKEIAKQDKDYKFLSCNNTWETGAAFLSGEQQPLYEIKLNKLYSIFATKQHKWLVQNDKGEMVTLRSDELKPGYKIPLVKNDKAINNPECKFNYDDGFHLGWWTGDGWTSYHINNKSEQVGFSFSDDELYIGEKILNFTNTLAKSPSTLRNDHGCKAKTYCSTDSNIIAYFQSLGIQKKELGVSKKVFSGNDVFVKGFIDGLFSSDGYVGVYPLLGKCNIVLVTSRKQLCLDVYKILNFYGIKSSIRESRAKSKFPNKKYNTDKIYTRYDLRISGKNAKRFALLFKLTNVKKQDKLNSILQTVGNKTSNDIFSTIYDVNLSNRNEDVYDLSINDNYHTFVCEAGVTGNCGELPLGHCDACRLFCINLAAYVKNPYTSEAYYDYEQLFRDSQIAQRFIDDIVDLEEEAVRKIIAKIENDPEPLFVKQNILNLWKGILDKCVGGRRTGTGITALGDAIAMLGIQYGSEESIDVTEKIYQALKLGCYKSSIDMAEEIGPFRDWDWQLEKDNPFLNRLKLDKTDYCDGELLFDKMSNVGRRNINLLTTAPTGTVSTQACITINGVRYHNTTSGIEPLFMTSFTRRKKGNPSDIDFRTDFTDQNGDNWMEFKVYHEPINGWHSLNPGKNKDENPYVGACAQEINWKNRVILQGLANRHIDNSISSTLNLPENVSVEEVQLIYNTAWKNKLKGITIYRDNCRTGVLIDNNKTGGKISKTDAPKRPKHLQCEVHHVTVKGTPYFILIGLLDNEPYEVFAGKNKNGTYIVAPSVKTGEITKKGRGKYHAIFDDGSELLPITAFCDDDEEVLTRLISTSLRHGTDISFLVHQLEKTSGDMQSFSKSIARALKKKIKNGTKVHGEECPTCQNELIRQEGCLICKGCGFSKCG